MFNLIAKPLLVRNSNYFFVGVVDRRVFHVRDWKSEDGIRFVVVDHGETYTALQGHVWEGPSEVTVDDTGMFVGKSTKAEEVAISCRVVVLNDIRSRRAG